MKISFIAMRLRYLVLSICMFLVLRHLWGDGLSRRVSVVDLIAAQSRDHKSALQSSINETANHDPRVGPCLWLEAAHQELQQHDFQSNTKLPFNWRLWLDLQPPGRRQCSGLAGFFGMCVNRGIDAAYSEATRRIMAHNHLWEGGLSPKKLLIVMGSNTAAYDVLVVPLTNSSEAQLRHQLVEQYQMAPVCTLSDRASRLAHDVSILASRTSFIDDSQLKHDVWRVMRGSVNQQQIDVDLDKFILPSRQLLRTTIANIESSNALGTVNEFDTALLNVMVAPVASKSFHEANMQHTHVGSHYDWRFFSMTLHSTYERQAILHRLVRTWFKLTRSLGIHSWLSHGSLLGWYWNGLCLPWDLDLDIQITMESLYKLARNYNQLLIVDVTDIEGALNVGMGQFFLDVGSLIFHRGRDNGENVIDARFIDVRTGIYIDLTALTFTDAAKKITLKEKGDLELAKVLASASGVATASYEELCQSRAALWNSQSLYNCKNEHFYTTEEITPLSLTLFEGIEAYVPRQYEQILQREYGSKCTTSTSYRQWQFDGELWTDNSGQWHAERTQVRHVVALHKAALAGDLESFRVDPWMVRQLAG